MKKYFVAALVAVMSFVSLAPAMARENEGRKDEVKAKIEIKTELRKEIKEERKDLKERIKELSEALRFAPRALNLTGKLVSVSNVGASSTEITVNISRVFPHRPKNMPSSTVSFPQASTTITLKITDKTLLIKTFGGKMTVGDLTVGDELSLVVKFNQDGSLDVRVVKDNSLHVLREKKGVIDSISTGTLSFVLKQEERTLTVNTNSSTKFRFKDSTSTSFTDLKVGDKVVITGIVNTNTNIVLANSVTIKKRQ